METKARKKNKPGAAGGIVLYILMTLSLICTVATFLIDVIEINGRKVWLLEGVNLVLKIFDINSMNAYFYIACLAIGIMYFCFGALLIKGLVVHFKDISKACSPGVSTSEAKSAWMYIVINYGQTISRLVIFIMCSAILTNISVSNLVKYNVIAAIMLIPFSYLYLDGLYGCDKDKRLYGFARIFILLVAVSLVANEMTIASFEQFVGNMIVLAKTEGSIGGRAGLYVVYSFVVENLILIALSFRVMITVYINMVYGRNTCDEKEEKNSSYRTTLIFTVIIIFLRCMIATFCATTSENIEFDLDSFKSMYYMISDDLLPILMLFVSMLLVNILVPAVDEKSRISIGVKR